MKKVITVNPLKNYCLEITFNTHEKKIFNMNPYLEIGSYAELKNIDIFNSAHVAFHSIEWNNGLDIDPHFLYEYSISQS